MNEEILDCCGLLVDILIFFLFGKEVLLLVDFLKGFFLDFSIGIDCFIEWILLLREVLFWWLRILGIIRSVFFFGLNYFVFFCMIEGWFIEVVFEGMLRLQVIFEFGWFIVEVLFNFILFFIKLFIDSIGRQDLEGIDKFVCVMDFLYIVFWGESLLKFRVL